MLKKWWPFVCGLMLILILTAPLLSPDYAQGRTIDSFEDSNVDEYDFQSGSTSDIDFVSDSKDGDTAIGLNNTSINNVTLDSFSDSGLYNYPAPGDTIIFWVKPDSPKAFFHFGVQDFNNYFEIRIDPSNNQFTLRDVSGGGGTNLTAVTATYSENNWYKFEINWNSDRTWSAKLFNENGTLLGSGSTGNTSYDTGGIGLGTFSSSNTGVNLFDNIHISGPPSIDTNTLSVSDGNDTLALAQLDGSKNLGDTFDHTVRVRAPNSDTVNLYYRLDGTTATTADTKVTFSKTIGDTYRGILPDPQITIGDRVNFILEGVQSGVGTSVMADSGGMGFEYRVINETPTIQPEIPDQTHPEDTEPIKIGLTDRASDTDGDAMKWTVTDGADTLVSDSLANGTFKARGEDTLTLTPVTDANGTSSIALSLGDGKDTTTDMFQIVLTPVNDTPVIGTPVDTQTINRNADTTYIDLNNRASDTEDDALKWTVTGDGDTVEASLDGVFRSGGDDTLSIKPKTNKTGTETLTLSVGDGTDTTNQTLNVVVLDNVPPNAPDTTFRTVSDSPITFVLPGNDPDAGDTIDQTLQDTSGLQGSLTGADSEQTYTPPNSTFSGTETFTYKAENSQGSDTGTVTIRVLEPASVTITGIVAESAGDTPLVAEEGGTIDVDITYKNGGEASVDLTRDTSNISILNESGNTITGQFQRELLGTASFQLNGNADTTVTWQFQYADTISVDAVGGLTASVDTTGMTATDRLSLESRTVSVASDADSEGSDFLLIATSPSTIDTAQSAWNVDTALKSAQDLDIRAGVTSTDTDASGNDRSWVDTGSASNNDRILIFANRTRFAESPSNRLGREITRSSNPAYSFFKETPDSFVNRINEANNAFSGSDTSPLRNTVIQVSIWLNQTGTPSNYLGDSLTEAVDVTLRNIDSTADPGELKVVKLDTATEEWVMVDTNPIVTGSAGNYTLEFRVPKNVGFSVFQVISGGGVSTTSDASEAIVYPNPFVPHDGDPSTGRYCGGTCGDGDGIHFGTDNGNGFPANTTLSIYTINGERVAQFTSTSSGIIQWNAKSTSGEKVATGVYLWVLDVAGGGTKNGKLSIVR